MATSKKEGVNWDRIHDTLDNVSYRQQAQQPSYKGTFSMENRNRHTRASCLV